MATWEAMRRLPHPKEQQLTVSNVVKFDPKKSGEDYLTPEEKRLRELNPQMHQCDMPSERTVKEKGWGPGTLFTCDVCKLQRRLVHIGLSPFREMDKLGNPIGEEMPPLAWRVIRP
jgi:hypothetical protein